MMRLQWGSDLVASYLSFADNQTLRAIDAIINLQPQEGFQRKSLMMTENKISKSSKVQ
jgi:hypothetical protein